MISSFILATSLTNKRVSLGNLNKSFMSLSLDTLLIHPPLKLFNILIILFIFVKRNLINGLNTLIYIASHYFVSTVPFCNLFVHCTFTDTKLLGRFPYCSVRIDNKFCSFYGSFFDIRFQEKAPLNTTLD